MAMNVPATQRNPSINRLYRNPGMNTLYRGANRNAIKLDAHVPEGFVTPMTVGPADIPMVEDTFWNRYQQGIMGAVIGVLLGAVGAIVMMNLTKGRKRRR